jgi:hypothetical protein
MTSITRAYCELVSNNFDRIYFCMNSVNIAWATLPTAGSSIISVAECTAISSRGIDVST